MNVKKFAIGSEKSVDKKLKEDFFNRFTIYRYF